MGCRVTKRPAVAPKTVAPKEKTKAKAPETKAPAPSTNDTFEAKPRATYQKIETVWKEGNITSNDDWQQVSR